MLLFRVLISNPHPLKIMMGLVQIIENCTTKATLTYPKLLRNMFPEELEKAATLHSLVESIVEHLKKWLDLRSNVSDRRA